MWPALFWANMFLKFAEMPILIMFSRALWFQRKFEERETCFLTRSTFFVFFGFICLFYSGLGFGRLRVRWGPKSPTSPNPSSSLLIFVWTTPQKGHSCNLEGFWLLLLPKPLFESFVLSLLLLAFLFKTSSLFSRFLLQPLFKTLFAFISQSLFLFCLSLSCYASFFQKRSLAPSPVLTRVAFMFAVLAISCFVCFLCLFLGNHSLVQLKGCNKTTPCF